MAVGPKSQTSTMRFNKFSVPGPLIALHERQRKLAETGEGQPLELMINCTVSGLKKDDEGVVRAIETSRGVLSWTDDDTKIVLCAGVSCLEIIPIIVVKKTLKILTSISGRS
jgi:L-2-hydroxyglutarate oxidase LhgO